MFGFQNVKKLAFLPPKEFAIEFIPTLARPEPSAPVDLHTSKSLNLCTSKSIRDLRTVESSALEPSRCRVFEPLPN